MSSVTVEDVTLTRSPGCDETTRRRGVRDLEPGQSLTFGRGSPDTSVDLTLQSAEVSRRAGTIRAVADYWLLTNASAVTYVVENLEGAGEHVKIPPGRADAPVPFELSRLLIPVDAGTYDLHVYAPQHAYLAGDPTVAGDTTVRPFVLDETSKYFRVLVALCEPRLRDPSSVAIPSSDDVARRLAPTGERMSRSAVDYHINYLAETKLRIRSATDGDRAESKRASLVALALRFNLVTEEHLGVLGPRSGADA
ncbi:FHA domain-containing protein [Solicola gregarius]|uniref:Serine/threonine protein kinase n=1 Tax=Solicola gregarius TaxID=2908642 RepID=A0AA46YMD5_9ACTN|nr:hypothetical protein [Solicola gregarius]UYM07632.1 hypothetical protein L0C25_11335 [Solicola gregarius]